MRFSWPRTRTSRKSSICPRCLPPLSARRQGPCVSRVPPRRPSPRRAQRPRGSASNIVCSSRLTSPVRTTRYQSRQCARSFHFRTRLPSLRVPKPSCSVSPAWRETLLPLMSLRVLLGFPPADSLTRREKVIVAMVRRALIGLVTDRRCALWLRRLATSIDPAPGMLAARSGGEAKIVAIYRAAERLAVDLTARAGPTVSGGRDEAGRQHHDRRRRGFTRRGPGHDRAVRPSSVWVAKKFRTADRRGG